METRMTSIALAALALAAPAAAQGAWADGFDTYALGSKIVGQGGWLEWNNGPAKNEVVSNTFAVSAPHSLAVNGDPIQLFSGYTSGRWKLEAKIYCPSATTKEFDFQLFSIYQHGSPWAWNALLQFNVPSQGMVNVRNGNGGIANGAFPLDTWFDLRIVIDLDLDTIDIDCATNPTVSYTYSGGVFGGSNHPKEIAAISLLTQFGNPTSFVYWDDLRLGPDVPDPTFFCTAKTTTACGTPAVAHTGVPSATQPSGFVVSAGPARTCKSGILLYNTALGAQPLPFQGGTLCVDSMGLRRAGPTSSAGTPGGANCDGAFAIDINTFSKGAWVVPDCAGNPSGTQANNAAPFLNAAGTTIHAQWWGRDSVATGSFVSDGLSWVVGP